MSATLKPFTPQTDRRREKDNAAQIEELRKRIEALEAAARADGSVECEGKCDVD